MQFRTLTLAAGLAVAGSSAFAEDCANIGVGSAWDLEDTQVVALYDCLKHKMAEGYAKGGDEVGSEYRSWTVTATRPAVAGAHGNRLLQTFANDVAAEQYLKFAEEGFEMPVGSVLAKESISISKKKMTGRPGPLFIMTKMEAGSLPGTADWLYGGVQPNGKPMKFKQSFCHDCHVSWEDQDHMAYPVEEVRIGSGG